MMDSKVRRAIIIPVILFSVFAAIRVLAGGAGETREPDAGNDTRVEGLRPSERGGSLERGRVEVPEGYERAVFAGGCFWCMEPPYDSVDGVYAVTSGFSGGTVANPSYQAVIAGNTGHREVVEIVFDPSRVSYRQLLEIFWVNIDPLDGGGQFCDRGGPYLSAIFYMNPEQEAEARASRAWAESRILTGGEFMTEVRAYEAFYPAEEYHQAYAFRNPVRYSFYRASCGRDVRLRTLWGS